ncbi:MAG: helix-turn-helix transcriptional regulator [Bacteroidetes bacterium]|nr:helix-turn-helix transcriptional regulator [Bacteroidota bacterium]
MFIHHNLLRVVRKRSQLTQHDLASILQLSDYSNVSRWEAGMRTPNVEVLLTYHLLFQVPVEELFFRQRAEICRVILPRLSARIDHLKTLTMDPKLNGRISYLASAAERLAAILS